MAAGRRGSHNANSEDAHRGGDRPDRGSRDGDGNRGVGRGGSTYLQTYTDNTVTAVAIKGPYVGSAPDVYNYIAMPITKDIILLVWLEPNSQHNTFVYNFKDHESSVVTYDQAGDPSLGSVFIVKKGTHPIP
jgi:hypothetical protein